MFNASTADVPAAPSHVRSSSPRGRCARGGGRWRGGGRQDDDAARAAPRRAISGRPARRLPLRPGCLAHRETPSIPRPDRGALGQGAPHRLEGASLDALAWRVLAERVTPHRPSRALLAPRSVEILSESQPGAAGRARRLPASGTAARRRGARRAGSSAPRAIMRRLTTRARVSRHGPGNGRRPPARRPGRRRPTQPHEDKDAHARSDSFDEEQPSTAQGKCRSNVTEGEQGEYAKGRAARTSCPRGRIRSEAHRRHARRRPEMSSAN